MADDATHIIDPGSTPPAESTPPAAPDPLAAVNDKLAQMQAAFEQREAKWAEERQQYAQMLGQQIAAQRQAAAPVHQASEPTGYFDADTAKNIEAIAERIADRKAYGILGRAQILQDVGTNPELEKLAQEELRNIASNPFYGGLSDDHKLALAVKEAQIKYLKSKQASTQATNTQAALQQAAAAQAAGASLPGTQIADTGSTKAKTLDEYIKEFSSEQANRDMVRRFYHVDPDSPRGQEELKKAARENWKGIAFGGSVGQAVEILGGGR